MNPDSPSAQEPAQPTTPPTRSKTVAIIMAVFLGVFAWLYTYARDKKKFWLGLVIGVALSIVTYTTNVPVLLAIDYICSLGIYVWVIVDTARKPGAYFIHYPNYQAFGPGTAPSSVPQSTAPVQPIDENAYQAIMPTKNMFALKSYYYSCVGIFPVVGLPFSILAITNGRKALRLYKSNPTPGAKAHAWFGIGLAVVELIFFAIIAFAFTDFMIR